MGSVPDCSNNIVFIVITRSRTSTLREEIFLVHENCPFDSCKIQFQDDCWSYFDLPSEINILSLILSTVEVERVVLKI